MIDGPALDKPPRERIAAALDIAVLALANIVAGNEVPPRYHAIALAALNKIATLRGKPT